MLAAFYREKGSLSLEEIEIPEPKANEVQVRIKENTVCGSTDMKIISGIRDAVFGRNIILGHESSGIITQTGGLVAGFRPGDRVACECWGTYAEYACTTTDKIQHIPFDMTWTEAALSELAMKVYQMAARNILPGDTVVILGQGAAGLIFTQMAAAMGASRIITTDLYDRKLELSKSLGADHTINASHEDVIKKVGAYTRGIGADVVIEAAGVRETVETAPYVAKRYGATILQFGVPPTNAEYSFSRMHDYGQTMLTIGSCRFIEPDLPYKRAIRLISEGKIKLDAFVTHRFSLKDINRAFELLKRNPGEVIKIAIEN